MAEINVRHEADPQPEEVRDDYTVGELIFWIVGILMIPLVPIVMVMTLTPFSGF